MATAPCALCSGVAPIFADLRSFSAEALKHTMQSRLRCATRGTTTELGPPPATSAPGLGSPPATFAPGLGSPLPALLRDWTCPCHICTASLWGRGRASRPTLRCSQLRIACMARHRCSSTPPLRPRLPPSWPCGLLPCAARDRPTLRSLCDLPKWMVLWRTALVLHMTAADGYPRAAAVACATQRGRAAVQGTLAGLR
jgi:hypothetical protein